MKYLAFILLTSISASAQTITTVGGGGATLGDGGPATNARIGNPYGINFDSNGDLYIACGAPNRVRKIDANGIITTIAGDGTSGYSGDGGPATNARFRLPTSVVFDSVGNIYISDKLNFAIRKIDAVSGIISTVCGDGIQGYTGDGGPASSARLFSPETIFIDRRGNMYVAENSKHVVRKISTSGIITTIAGTGVAGYNGDGILATTAQLYFPQSIAVDDFGQIYIADLSNFRIRKIDSFGIISTFGGNGVGTYIGDSIPATSAQFFPNCIKFDNENNLYIGGDNSHRVYKIDEYGYFYTVAGNGLAAHAGDGGLATAASINRPGDVAMDACENLYISENVGNYIRKVTFNPVITPTVSITGTTSASVGAIVTVNASVSGAGSSYTVRWMNKGTLFATTTVPVVTYTKAAGTDTITARVVPTEATGCYDSTITAVPHIVTVLPVSVGHHVQQSLTAQVYPNPANVTLYIQSPQPVLHLLISNLMGQQLIEKEGNDTIMQVDIAALTPGIYIIKLNKQYTYRFVKE